MYLMVIYIKIVKSRACTLATILLDSFKLTWAKAQVSLSDRNLSVVRCHCFTFSSSSPEPLDQYQANLAQSILCWRGFKCVHLKGPALFQEEIIMKLNILLPVLWHIYIKKVSTVLRREICTGLPSAWNAATYLYIYIYIVIRSHGSCSRTFHKYY